MAQVLQFHPFLCLANGGADADFRWKWGIAPLLVSLIWLEPKMATDDDDAAVPAAAATAADADDFLFINNVMVHVNHYIWSHSLLGSSIDCHSRHCVALLALLMLCVDTWLCG